MSLHPAITARPLSIPLPLLGATSTVDIHHPSVSGGPPILQFYAFPSEPGSGVVGVPLGVVLDACFVVAGNQPGKLYLHASPHEQVANSDSDPDGLLIPGRYHFVVVQAGGRLDYHYHLCESFAAWTPPVNIPPRWLGGEAARAPPPPNVSDISAAVKWDDKVCIMTAAATGLQVSHLVPKVEDDWFSFHFIVLTGYGGDPAKDLNSVRNEVTLRADLNGQGFDHGHFLFVPYAGHVVAVFVDDMAQDLAHEYHLRAVNLSTRIRRGYLFVRFAWNVFNFLAPGLVAAAAVIRPLEERPDGGGFLKRKRADDAGGGSITDNTGGESSADNAGGEPKAKRGGIGRGGGSKRKKLRGGSAEDSDGEGSSLTEDEESAPNTEGEDEAQLAVFETLDAALQTRPLTVEDVEVGRYPGFSVIKRLELEYRRAHPEVSAVGDSCVWEEADDERAL
ncbi:hypothetical protein K438DRAFT_1953567 [Mycena galopus ATCC 62051]|nr:hypothetical protein K438DRAFT_1953567 [Mycena galopus ATCC 62051]